MSAAVLPSMLRDTVLAPLNGTELRPEGAADRTRMGWGDNRHVVDPMPSCACPPMASC